MNNFNGAHPWRLLAAGALMACASLAHAQYVWVDEKGIKQFSDRAPPPSIPAKDILKAPGAPRGPVLVPIAPAGAPVPAAAPAAAAKAPPTLAERNADFRKRAKERADQELRDRDEVENKAAKAENCDSARQMKQALDSGVRIGRTDRNGERSFLSDAQRSHETNKVNKVLDGCR